MSVLEVLHRVKNKLRATKEQHFGAGAEQPPVAKYIDTINWIGGGMPQSIGQWQDAADVIIDGRLNIFNLLDYSIGTPPRWNIDPKTGIKAPLEFGKTMNYRDEDTVGDIKYLWEPSRHLQLVTLCMAFKLTKDSRYSSSFCDQLDSWFEQCPYLMGAQWVSSLELGIRLINWAICWQLIGGYQSSIFEGDKGTAFRDRWLKAIYQHAHFIKGHYSRYSSANNHLIGEASGVFIASLTWPYWDEFSVWGSDARGVLEAEAVKQTFEDGVNKEQAISYQQFVLDFLLLPYLAAEANQQPFSEKYKEIIESMLTYLASMMDVNGNLPMIGDADDGYAVKLDHNPDFCPYRSLLATGAVLFNRSDFKVFASELDNKSLILLGNHAEDSFARLAVPAALEVRTTFQEGGYHILGHRINQPDEIKWVMDTGPLGYGGIAAHGHADALSAYLTVAGHEILIDPGTYAYHTDKKWRDYFRGTSAHNTIRVDGVDQSEIGGNFMWLTKAESVLHTFEDSGEKSIIEASHNGYLRLPCPLTHQRKVIFHKNCGVFELSDELHCSDEHEIEQFWHFSEFCKVSIINNILEVSNQSVFVRMELDPTLSLAVFKGDTERPSGWVSRCFDSKEKSTSVCASKRINGNSTLNTRISIEIATN